MKQRILVIDDDSSICDLLKLELDGLGYEVVTQTSPEAALQCLATDDFGVVISDINMRGMSGVELCQRVVQLREATPVIVMTAFATIESAVASIRAGAYDFVTKPFETNDLALTIERALAHRALREEVTRLRRTVNHQLPFDDIVGSSAAMKKVYDLVSRVADTEATVMITGESGTGKELIAKALHSRSARSAKPFVAINCAAMPENLLESELFGHVKGAFTDARGTRPGLFVKASGGTLFLDEVGEMPPGMQAKLLRAIQERKVRAVGADIETPFDTRIVAATSRNMEDEVKERRFREDLYYRLNVVHVKVPPLRERENDILLLATHFLERASGASRRVVGIKRDAMDRLSAYGWPGNVRELQNCMERAVALAQTDHVGVCDLPDRIIDFKPTATITNVAETADPKKLLPMDEIERRYIVQVLDALSGNKAAAARVLGLDRRTLYRKLERMFDGASTKRENGAIDVPHDAE